MLPSNEPAINEIPRPQGPPPKKEVEEIVSKHDELSEPIKQMDMPVQKSEDMQIEKPVEGTDKPIEEEKK